MGFLDKLFGGDATKKAARANAAALNSLNTRGQEYITDADTAATGQLQQVPGLYEPYAQTGQGANAMLGNALGLGGAEGNAAAQGAFTSSPGYQFAVDQGLQAATRAASAGGSLASGNTLDAATRLARGLASQDYGSWLQNLYGLSGQGMQAAGGQATGYTNLANQAVGTGDRRLGLDASVVQGLNANRNNAAAAQEQGVSNMLGLAGKFLGFLPWGGD